MRQLKKSPCESMKDRFAILDCPPGLNPQQMKDWRMTEAGYDTKYGAVYYPWIRVANPLGNGESILVPPSGYMAGIYARSDTERGVHKAPANEVVRGAMGLGMQITKSEQDILNPIGVNCIRAFPGRGIRVWGARTLSSDASWRYINVRRLFNFVEKSIQMGTQWIVFEPNDPDLWARIRRDISAFLSNVWRSGALFGATPSQAFYVKCDEETNPPEVRDLGQVIIEIGLAPVKPAEFVIFRISQWASGSETSE
jgi:phage tail sheath protein FI